MILTCDSLNQISSPLLAIRPCRAFLRGTETILLVEDDPSLRDAVRRALDQLGYRILEAPTGVKALEVWKQNRGEIHLLLTDLVMPGGMNGFELAQHARKVQPDIKVLLTSGFPEHAADPSADPAVTGARLLQKPYRAGDLARALLATLHS